MNAEPTSDLTFGEEVHSWTIAATRLQLELAVSYLAGYAGPMAFRRGVAAQQLAGTVEQRVEQVKSW